MTMEETPINMGTDAMDKYMVKGILLSLTDKRMHINKIAAILLALVQIMA